MMLEIFVFALRNIMERISIIYLYNYNCFPNNVLKLLSKPCTNICYIYNK